MNIQSSEEAWPSWTGENQGESQWERWESHGKKKGLGWVSGGQISLGILMGSGGSEFYFSFLISNLQHSNILFLNGKTKLLLGIVCEKYWFHK